MRPSSSLTSALCAAAVTLLTACSGGSSSGSGASTAGAPSVTATSTAEASHSGSAASSEASAATSAEGTTATSASPSISSKLTTQPGPRDETGTAQEPTAETPTAPLDVTSVAYTDGGYTLSVTTKPGATFFVTQAGTTISGGTPQGAATLTCTVTKRTPVGMLTAHTMRCDGKAPQAPALVVTVKNALGQETSVSPLKAGRVR